MKRLILGGGVLVLLALTSSASAQIASAAAAAADAASARRQYGTVKYRFIDGALAKKIDKTCASLWFDDDEVLLIEYRIKTYLIRINSPGNVGLACKVY